ncbi:hypothetical protein DBR40_19910 [Pedobacter sp. KBW01]|uniref:hypothetical protein n=1 Tax=Pedobacter sp. KBW01 TaxID=2153364 RepID=UPI000F5A1FF4|nr:hypothetical protein [Pedobacter sp. KBW01]RQO68509.1 hypothetical protein DBR40_19910 [Pedobacter sp. KBW01]
MAFARKNNRSNNSRSDNNGGSQKKHSGCKYKATSKNGSPVTTGWNYSRRHGLVTFLCVTTKNTEVHTSKSGKEWLNVMVKVTKPMCADTLVSGLMERHTGKVIVKEMGIVLNPKAPNGGYCGKYGS